MANTKRTAGFTVETRPLDSIKPYERNARKIPEAAIAKVALSLETYGWRQPIVVDKDGVIVVGHGRRLAALKLGWTEAPVHVATDLSAAQIKAYRIMDNRSHEEADWDLRLLGGELADLRALDMDLGLTGLEPLDMEAAFATAVTVEAPLTDPGSVPALPKEAIAKPGDVWILGTHRLMCGDSTMVDDVAKLMDGAKAHMVFTDPPYNVDYDGDARPNGSKKTRFDKILNDHMGAEDFRAFLDLVYSNLDIHLEAGRAIYICHADTEGHHFRNAFLAQPWKLQSCLIWAKSVLCFGRADYHWMHEPILYGWKEGAPHVWHGDRKQTSLIEVKTDHYNKSECDTDGYVHPTQKPVGLIAIALNNSSVAGEIVLDLFGGSGSTLIACEKAARSARLMEKDPRYCDVIVARWEAFTGGKAVLA
jgi:DNA modification methylase